MSTQKAITYVSDIILGRTGSIIDRKYQRNMIREYAQNNNIEIVAWFEDEIYSEDLIMRPGIQQLLGYEEKYDLLLVERVWALSRQLPQLEPFFKEMDRKSVSLKCSTTMWDCVSQQCRRRFDSSLFKPDVSQIKKEFECVQEKETESVTIKKPSQLFFLNLIKDPLKS
ncbi:MAG: hypothetical protein ACD_62C00045G0002 [uncultured bacterium]|nr:MAG: hypothetical protein ACD_62C00045G0002 [uncultured bacterium]HLD44867.1 recombinase family protein [bacterium]